MPCQHFQFSVSCLDYLMTIRLELCLSYLDPVYTDSLTYSVVIYSGFLSSIHIITTV